MYDYRGPNVIIICNTYDYVGSAFNKFKSPLLYAFNICFLTEFYASGYQKSEKNAISYHRGGKMKQHCRAKIIG